jgi:hypothetical protein
MTRVERQLVVENVATIVAGQIEVRVLCEIHRRRGIGDRVVFDDELVVVGDDTSRARSVPGNP